MVMYRESKDVNVIVDSVIIRKPQVTVEHESITHRIWAVSDKEVRYNMHHFLNLLMVP